MWLILEDVACHGDGGVGPDIMAEADSCRLCRCEVVPKGIMQDEM